MTIYAISIFGIGIRKFYCCGKLKSFHVSFIQEVKENSAKRERGTNNCCKTTHQFFKVKDNHKAADNLINVPFPFIRLQGVIPIFETPVHFTEQITAANRTHAPPLGVAIPIYISNCDFRI